MSLDLGRVLSAFTRPRSEPCPRCMGSGAVEIYVLRVCGQTLCPVCNGSGVQRRRRAPQSGYFNSL